MGAVPVWICFRKTKTTDIKNFNGTEVLAKRDHVVGKTMWILEEETKTPFSIIINRVMPRLVETVFSGGRLKEVCNLTYQCQERSSL
jgi:hypothetical protein